MQSSLLVCCPRHILDGVSNVTALLARTTESLSCAPFREASQSRTTNGRLDAHPTGAQPGDRCAVATDTLCT
jgi:hypothetical protein